MCGLHIVVHADELEELINYYQVRELNGLKLMSHLVSILNNFCHQTYNEQNGFERMVMDKRLQLQFLKLCVFSRTVVTLRS